MILAHCITHLMATRTTP